MASVVINGDTSGSVTLSAPTAAGSTTITLPASTGNALVDVGSSLTATGYVKLSNGLIIQWGTTASIGTDSGLAITYPIAFPTATLNVNITPIRSIALSGQGESTVSSVSTTGFTLNNGADTTKPYYWYALGI